MGGVGRGRGRERGRGAFLGVSEVVVGFCLVTFLRPYLFSLTSMFHHKYLKII